jgi:hypothetical protein
MYRVRYFGVSCSAVSPVKQIIGWRIYRFSERSAVEILTVVFKYGIELQLAARNVFSSFCQALLFAGGTLSQLVPRNTGESGHSDRKPQVAVLSILLPNTLNVTSVLCGKFNHAIVHDILIFSIFLALPLKQYCLRCQDLK